MSTKLVMPLRTIRPQSLVPQTFVDVPDMAVVFYVALGEAVKVDFSASISSPSRGPLLIRLLFDDNPSLTIEPSKIRINPNSTATRYTATFLLPIENGLGPGNHIVKIQWRSPQPLQVTSSGRVLVVEHN